jgi:hypothetical protein
MGALDILDPPIQFDDTIKREIIQVRDLNEHWKENMPVFNVAPSTEDPPRSSGKAFLARNPRRTPFAWSRWESGTGPLVTPNVPAETLHALVAETLDSILGRRPDLAPFIPDRSPSPWHGGEGWTRWLPAVRD